MQNIIHGLRLHAQAAQLVIKHRRLLMLSLASAVVFFLLFILGTFLAIEHLGDLLNYFVSLLAIDDLQISSDSWWAKVLNYGLVVVKTLAKGILGIILIVLLFLVVFVVGVIISAPLYDFLSEEVEKIKGIRDETPFSLKKLLTDSTRSVVTEIQKATIFLTISLASLLLSLIPFIGLAISLVLTNFVAALSFGFTFADYPMARRVWPIKQRFDFCKQHWQELVGMGLLFFVPIVNFAATPLFVVSGTLLFIEHDVKNH